MSKNPYCEKCGVIDLHHSKFYCGMIEKLEERLDFMRRARQELRKELAEALAVIANTAKTVQAFRNRSERMKAQRDLALFLGLKFSRGVYESCPAANAFDEFQQLRAQILKNEGYHPGWNRPDFSVSSAP